MRLVYNKTVDSVFRALWLATQSVNILHYSLIHHEEPQEVIFLHGIWRHIKEFGIEGQIRRISSPVKLEKRC